MLEIACFNVESALIAQDAGADRIEFCAGAKVGGITPSYEDWERLKTRARVPINAMIRPRGGDFCYSTDEFENMKEDIRRIKPFVHGFVFGILTDELGIDVERNRQLVELAKPKPCTFHRAFDEVSNPIEAADNVISCGFSSILTSGCASRATDGTDVLLQLVKHVRNNISIIVGGGVRSSNIVRLKATTGAEWFHSSAIIEDGEVASGQEIEEMRKALSDGLGEYSESMI
jgi:copper homeostasis protein